MGMGRDEDWDDEAGYGACMQMDNGDGSMEWTMRDGRTVLIVDMTNRHLRNTLRMLQRKGANVPELSALVDEARKRRLRW
jgi:hypothetical protein